MYRSNTPVVAKEFFNRQSELKRLCDVIRAGQWMAIVGLRKQGKTSLLLETERRMSEEFVFCSFDVFEFSPLSLEFFRHYALRCVDRLLSPAAGRSLATAAEDNDDYQRLLNDCLTSIKVSQDLAKLLASLPVHEMTDGFIRDCLQLPEDVARAVDKELVVSIDEFQTLAERKLGDWIAVIRSIWQRHKQVRYVISGSERTLLTEMVTEKHSPFFQHFDLMELGPFRPADAIELLMSNAPEDRPLSRTLAEQIVATIGGQPFYLQIVGEAITRYSPPLDKDTFKQALQETLFSRTGRLALYFDVEYRRLVGRSTQLAATLSALANKSERLRDLSQRLKIGSGASAKYLERLGDAVERDGDIYGIRDPLFATWLRWRQPGGTVVPMTVLGNEAEQRAAEHLAQIGFDLIYQSRASRGAFDLLATRGAMQLGVQVKRHRLPVRFTAAEWNRLHAEALRLGWHWIVLAVTPPPESRVILLDPSNARKKQGWLLDETSIINNLLMWLDQKRIQ